MSWIHAEGLDCLRANFNGKNTHNILIAVSVLVFFFFLNPPLGIITYYDSSCPPKKLSPFSSIMCRSAHISPPPCVLLFHFLPPPTPVMRRRDNQRRGNFQTNLFDTENICWCAVRTLLLVSDPRGLTSPICLIFANFPNCLRDQLQ